MDSLTLRSIVKVDGQINLPGSKSLSNRALLLSALAAGSTQINNLLVSDDVRHMLNALQELGVNFELFDNDTTCIVHGLGEAFQLEHPKEIFLGNAGTAMRPLCAVLCLGSGEYTLTGEPRMEERPIGALVRSLQQAGADIKYLKNDDFPPVLVQSNGLAGGTISIDGSISSQFLSALLMALPLASGSSTVKIEGELVSKPYIDMTLNIMAKFGVCVDNEGYQCFSVAGNQVYKSPGNLLVEGDASSASYFLAAAAVKGGAVTVKGVGKQSIQGDIRFADVLEKMGANVCWQNDSVTVTKGHLYAIDMDLNHIPDAAMTIAITALFAKGTTTIRNIYNWRVKETDRLAAMSTELRKLGANVVEGRDFIQITPPEIWQHAEIDTYNDHRMAMCFSLAALDSVPVTINDPGCTAKTFPNYFEEFAGICQYKL